MSNDTFQHDCIWIKKSSSNTNNTSPMVPLDHHIPIGMHNFLK